MATTPQSYLSGKISCNVSAELMPNYIAGSAIDAQFQIDVAQDANGDPILFSISSPQATDDGPAVNQFYATMRNTATQTGWNQVNISPRTDRAVQAFGVSQDAKTNSIVLVVAIDDGAGGSEVYLTASLPSDTSQTDWTNFAAQWYDRPGTPSDAIVTKLLVGSNSSLSSVPLVIAAVQSGDSALNYFIQGDTTKTNCQNFDAGSTSCWWPYVMPEGAQTLLDLVIGSMYLDQYYRLGTYALYTVGDELELMFTSVPDQYYQPHYWKLTAPAGAVALQTLPDPDPAWQGCSTLYVGGNGLSVFEASAQLSNAAAAQSISSDAAFADVKQLLARADSSHVSLWVRNHDQSLYYLRGDQNSMARNWTTPLSLRQNVARIAAQRNQPRAANEVFAVGSDNQTIAYIWQDPTSTLWKESDLPLPALTTVQKFPCYTSVLSFLDENGNPAANQDVQVTASEWTYATVNGYFKSLDPNDPVTVQTDSSGKVTIINKVSSVTTPIFQAAASFLDAPATINPAANVIAGLGSIQSGQDLLDATTQDGEQVVTGDIRNDTDQLDAAASGLQQLLPMLNQVPADGSPYTDATENSFVAAPQVWGLNFAGGRMRFHQGDEVKTHMLPQLQTAGAAMALHPRMIQLNVVGDTVNAIASVAGDVLEAMWNGVQKVTQIIIDTTTKVVNGVAQVIVYLGEQIVSFVIRTIGDILSLINWIFEVITVGLEKLIKWLGFIFSWDDILNTHEVISYLSTETVAYYGAVLDNAADDVRRLFDKLIVKVRTMPALQVPGEQDSNLFALQTKAAQLATPEQMQTVNDINNSPGGSFSTYQLMHGGTLTGTSPDEDNVSSPIEAFFKDVLEPTLKDLFKNIKGTVQDLIDLVHSDNLTVNNVLKVFTSDFMVTLLEAMRDIIAGFIDALSDTIAWLNEILIDTLPIPFVSGLYSLITQGSPFTILDGLSLLFSIPATIGYKLMNGQAPFSDDDVTWIKSKTYADIYPAQLFPQAGNLMLAATPQSETSETEAGKFEKVYSKIGGLMWFGSNLTSCLSYAVKAAAQGEVRFLDKLDTVMDTLYFITGFPFKEGDDDTEQLLDLPIWIGEGVGLGIKAVLAKMRRTGVMEKAVAEECEGLYESFLGLGSSALYLTSFFVEKDQTTWDYVKNGQNLCSGLGGTFAGISGLLVEDSEDTGQPEITAAGVAGFLAAFTLKGIAGVLGITRMAATAGSETEIFYTR